VVCVAADDAEAFARWAGVDLPGDSQWEAAVLAGGTGRRLLKGEPVPPEAGNLPDKRYWAAYPNGTSLPDFDDGFAFLAPVGSFHANPLGLRDMSGNVREWVRCVPAEARSNGQPLTHVMRGFAWSSCTGLMCMVVNPGVAGAPIADTSVRIDHGDSYADNATGFRCAKALPKR
jgi:formylglycine-generating enzyme required for sulfatase activity